MYFLFYTGFYSKAYFKGTIKTIYDSNILLILFFKIIYTTVYLTNLSWIFIFCFFSYIEILWLHYIIDYIYIYYILYIYIYIYILSVLLVIVISRWFSSSFSFGCYNGKIKYWDFNNFMHFLNKSPKPLMFAQKIKKMEEYLTILSKTDLRVLNIDMVRKRI